MKHEDGHAAGIALLLKGKRAAIARLDVCRRSIGGGSFAWHVKQPNRRPWASLAPHPALVIGLSPTRGAVLEVGCGPGDDAEALSARGWRVTAFDVARTAITLCRGRFADSAVHYVTAVYRRHRIDAGLLAEIEVEHRSCRIGRQDAAGTRW